MKKNLPFVSQTPLQLQKWTAFSSRSFLISWYLEGKEYCTILKSTFSFLAGKADANVMKTCVLHINERLKEGNSQEQRFVVVVPKKKAKLTQNIIPIAYEVMVCLFEFSV